MTGYIAKDDLIELLSDMQGRCGTRAELRQNAKIWNQVKDMPTADVAPIKHGKWIEEIDPEEDCWNEEVLYCSCCDEPIRVHETDNTYFLPTRRTLKYCPNCGAKMDAERDKNE